MADLDHDHAVVHVLCDVSEREMRELETQFRRIGRPYAILRITSDCYRSTYRLTDIVAEVERNG
jgi:hypothetical protein